MNTENFGTVEFEGKVITLKQDPYLNGPHGAPRYEASGVDQEGNDVKVTWSVKEEYLDGDGHLDKEKMEYLDDADLCDWDTPVEVYVY